MPTISVIIPCLNEEKYLGHLLDDLTAQTIKPDEVIVADCNSEDKTIQVATNYNKKLPVRIARSKIRSPGAARNAGAKLATTAYLLFIDADMRIPADTISAISNSLDSDTVDFLSPVYRSDGLHWADRFWVRVINGLMFLSMKLGRLAGIGGVMCVKKEMHETIGGFDEAKQTKDDIDYARRLRRGGASFKYLRTLVTTTSSRRFINGGALPLFRLVIRSRRPKRYGHYK